MPLRLLERGWDSQPLSDLTAAPNLILRDADITRRFMGGMCTSSAVGMRPFGIQATFNNPFALAGLSKVGTALGNFERHGGGGYSSQTSFPAYGGDKFTQVTVINYVPPAAAMGGFIRMSGPGNGYSHLITINADGTLSVNCNGVAGLIVTTAILATGRNVIIFTNDRVSGSQKLYINDVEVGSAANAGYAGFTQSFIVCGENTAGNTSVGLFYGFARIINRAEVTLLSYDATLIFEPEIISVYFAVASGAAALAGNAAGVSTAAGALSTAISTSGASVSVASAAGALSTQIPFAGVAVSVAIAGGNLSAQIKFQASALAQAMASAGLSSALLLAAAATGSAGASGTLDAAASLVGAAQGVASASVVITVQIRLSGAAIAQALAAGGLTAPGQGLAGAAVGVASAAGQIITAIPIIGAAQAYAVGAGALATIIALVGASASLSGASGDLIISLQLSGSAMAQALAGGALTAQIQLQGTALAQAAAAGQLTGGAIALPTPATRTLATTYQNRTLRVPYENRTVVA